MMSIDYDIKSASKLDTMSIEEKTEYFKEVREYILSLPFDEEQLDIGEKKFLETADFIVPKFKKYFEPNISTKLTKNPDSPFILVSNHLGSFDQIMLSTAFPDLAFHYMIAESLMQIKNLCVGKFYLARGAFVVNRNTPEKRRLAIPEALKYLYRGKNVVLFPEASRQIRYGSDGTVQDFKTGAATLAQMTSSPIIPTAINNNFKKGAVYINVGEVFKVGIEDNIHEETKELREKVIELWQENQEKGALILTKNKKSKLK